MNTAHLAAKAHAFVMHLDEMGFGRDEPINGGDCVEFVDQNQQLLRLLPALAELAGAAEACRGTTEVSALAEKLVLLYAALDKLKGVP